MFDVTALGEILIDFTPCGIDNDIPVYAQNPGGAPLNVLAQNAILGGRTAFIGKTGKDSFGQALKTVMDKNRICTDGLAVSDQINTTLAFVSIGKNGERFFSFYRNPGADITLSVQDLNEKLIKESHIFHIGSLSTTDEPARSATYEALKIAKEAGCIISYDPNYREPLWKSEEIAKKAMIDLLQYADILKVSEEEMELLAGTQDLIEGSKKLADFGISLVCISRGDKGAFIRRGTDCREIQGFKVKAVDTNGAGDSFFGAIHYKIKDMSLQELQNIKIEDLVNIVRFANAAGALTTTKRGAIPAMPEINEIEVLMNQSLW